MNEDMTNKPQLITKISSYDILTETNPEVCMLPILIIGAYIILSLIL